MQLYQKPSINVQSNLHHFGIVLTQYNPTTVSFQDDFAIGNQGVCSNNPGFGAADIVDFTVNFPLSSSPEITIVLTPPAGSIGELLYSGSTGIYCSLGTNPGDIVTLEIPANEVNAFGAGLYTINVISVNDVLGNYALSITSQNDMTSPVIACGSCDDTCADGTTC